MSEGMGSSAITVYVRLMDEGTEVYRPVVAQETPPHGLRLLEPIGGDAGDEEWEFPAGAVVRCEEQQRDGQRILVAVGLAKS
jgi:hypothetical protein